jgi:hypothetical protein
MPITINQTRLDELKACTDALEAQWVSIQEGIDFEIAAGTTDPSVPWFDDERRDVLRQATLLVFLSELNLACYPLSVSAVVFIE